MSASGVQPLLIFSITRSGSTLLQRVLGTYPQVATVSEPWLLIPLLYTMRRRGVVAEYTHDLMVQAVEDFSAQLPNGVEDYRAELRALVLRLYEKAAGDSETRYFLDKTPPYFFVVDDAMELFPEAKVVFLWRNPLSVVASLIQWDEGRWNPARYRENLFGGTARLLSAYRDHPDRSVAVRYEDLLTEGETHWRRVTDHLGLDFDPDSLERFSDVKLEGRMGDPSGVKLYSRLSTEPLTKWKSVINNPIRKAWCARYLRWLGHEQLAAMGYDLDALLAELDAVPTSRENLRGDGLRLATALVKEPWRARARRSLGLGGPSSFRYILDGRAGPR